MNEWLGYDKIVEIKKEFEKDHNALNRELIIKLCNNLIILYKDISGVSEDEKEKIGMGERKGKFSIVSKGSPFTTNLYYGDEKIPCVKEIIVSIDAEDPVLRAEAILNLDGSNCNLEIDYENMIISFGGQQFYLIPKPINSKTKQRIFDLIQKENEEGE